MHSQTGEYVHTRRLPGLLSSRCIAIVLVPFLTYGVSENRDPNIVPYIVRSLL